MEVWSSYMCIPSPLVYRDGVGWPENRHAILLVNNVIRGKQQ